MAPSASTWRTPFSTAGMYCEGIAPPNTHRRIQTGAPLERFDPQLHFGELAGAARLFCAGCGRRRAR